MARQHHRSTPSAWKHCAWEIGSGLRCRADFAWDPHVAAVDATWPVQRPRDSEHAGWMWATIVRQCRDRVVLLDEVDDVVAIWGSKLKLRLVGEVRVYRLDFLEVHPARPGVGIGAIAMGLVADQAARDGAKGIVLSSLPQSVGFYEALGGSKKLPGVWNAERGTVPFYFDTSAMGVLRELLADAQADG